MHFQKGNKLGNRAGRPKKPEIEELRRAIKAVEKNHDKTVLEHFVERSYTNDNVLVALMKKMVPDIKQIDTDLNIGGQKDNPVNIIVFDGTDTKPKIH